MLWMQDSKTRNKDFYLQHSPQSFKLIISFLLNWEKKKDFWYASSAAVEVTSLQAVCFFDQGVQMCAFVACKSSFQLIHICSSVSTLHQPGHVLQKPKSCTGSYWSTEYGGSREPSVAAKATLPRETVSASETLDLGPDSTSHLLSLTAGEPATSGLVILRFRCLPVPQRKGTPGNVALLSST